eukprot:jgi/Chlat1/5771/Chrsp387S05515
MGAGRKTQTVTYGDTLQRRVHVQFRNLGQENLAGVIFGCTKDTMRECLIGRIFGLPQIHIQYVQWIEPGMPIFLFNYSDRKLHGVFQAVTEGNTNINPYGWTGGRSTPTSYPAQVEVKRIAEPPPLTEEEFQHFIIDNYYTDKHFMFELDAQQVEWLHEAFRKRMPQSARMGTPSAALPAPKSAPSAPAPALASAAIENGSVKPATPKPVNAWVKRAQAEPSTDSANGYSPLASPPYSQVAEHSASNSKPQTPPIAKGVRNSNPASDKPSSSSWIVMRSLRQHRAWRLKGTGPHQVVSMPPSAHAQKDSPSAPVATNSISTALRPSSSPPLAPAATDSAHSMRDVDTQQSTADTHKPGPAPMTGSASAASTSEQPTANTYKPAPYLPAPVVTGNAFAAATLASASSTDARLPTPGDAPADDSATSVSKPLSSAEVTDSTPTESAALGVAQPLQKKASLSETQVLMQRAAAEQVMLQRERDSVQMDAMASSACLQRHLQMCAAGIAQFREETIRAAHSREGSELHALQAEVAALRAAQARTNAELAALRSEVALLRGIPPALSFMPSTNVSLPTIASQPPRQDMYIIGGFSPQRTWYSSAARFSPATGEWEDRAPMAAGRGYCGAVAVKQHVYVCGGVCGGGNGGAVFRSVERYDTHANSWSTLPSLSVPRGSLAAAADLDGRVYALGGGNATQQLSVVELFDPERGEWMLAKSLSERRYCVSAATVDHCIYAVGGFEGTNYLKSMERFDPREGSWTPVRDMLEARGTAAVAAVGNYLYAVGGFNGSILNTVEVYDLRMDSWYPLAPALLPRAYCAVGVINHDIYVLGGICGQMNTATAEKYTITKNEWSYVDLPANASSGRSFVAAAVVTDRY